MEKFMTTSSGNYEEILSSKNGRYFFHIKELQIIASGDTIESAHNKLLEKKNEVIKVFEEAGSLFKLPPPFSGQTPNQTNLKARETGFFAIKALIAGFIFVLVISFLGVKINERIIPNLKSYIKSSTPKIGRFLEQEIYSTSRVELSEEKKEKIKEHLRVIVSQIKPFVDELWPLFPSYSRKTLGNE
jgi:hypothetical protein